MSTGQALALIILLVCVIIAAPVVTIWSLNTLFGLGIAYTFWTWLAAVWLTGVFGGAAAAVKKG